MNLGQSGDVLWLRIALFLYEKTSSGFFLREGEKPSEICEGLNTVCNRKMRALGTLVSRRVSWNERRKEICSLIFSEHFSTDGGDGVESSRIKIFDRDLKRRQRDRAAWLMRPNDSFVDTVADNLLDRLEDCKRTFPTALCMGGSLDAIKRLLRGRGGIEKLIMMDTSYDMVKMCKEAEQLNGNVETSFLVGDEEFLPVKEKYA